MAPLDAEKNFCGFGSMEGYPKLLLTSFKNVANPLAILQTGVCIKECPHDQSMKFENGKNCKDNKEVKCSVAKSSKTFNNPLDICFPVNKNALDKAEQEGFEKLIEAIKSNPAGKMFEDMKASSTSMYMSFGTALVWAIVYIYLMSIFAEALAWCCVFLVQIGLIGGTVGMYFMWEDAKKKVAFEKAHEDYAKMSDEEKKELEKGPTMYLALMIVVGVLALIFLCMIVCGRKSLQTAIDVIDASADYVAHNKRVILVPNLHFLFTVIVVCIWLYAFL